MKLPTSQRLKMRREKEDMRRNEKEDMRRNEKEERAAHSEVTALTRSAPSQDRSNLRGRICAATTCCLRKGWLSKSKGQEGMGPSGSEGESRRESRFIVCEEDAAEKCSCKKGVFPQIPFLDALKVCGL